MQRPAEQRIAAGGLHQLPRYITATSSQRCSTTPRSGDKQKRDPAIVAQIGKQIDDLRLNRHIEAEMGSSAMIKSG
jgi:hypothetical protein